jgi:hypothetical protein
MLDALQQLIERAQAQGVMRPDVVAEDVTMLLAGVGRSRGGAPAPGWERHLGVVVDGLRAEGAQPLPSKPLRRSELDALISRRSLPAGTRSR